MTSRSEMMPAIRPSSVTSSAPMRFSPSLCTTSVSDASAAMVSTALPLLRITAAMVMGSSRLAARRLDSPTSGGQREAVPQPDPLPSPRHSMLRRFWRIFRLLALLSIIIAAIAVVMVARGDPATHVHMLIATALGVSLTVLLGTGLMTLIFLSSSSGHDDEASAIIHRENDQHDRS